MNIDIENTLKIIDFNMLECILDMFIKSINMELMQEKN